MFSSILAVLFLIRFKQKRLRELVQILSKINPQETLQKLKSKATIFASVEVN